MGDKPNYLSWITNYVPWGVCERSEDKIHGLVIQDPLKPFLETFFIGSVVPVCIVDDRWTWTGERYIPLLPSDSHHQRRVYLPAAKNQDVVSDYILLPGKKSCSIVGSGLQLLFSCIVQCEARTRISNNASSSQCLLWWNMYQDVIDSAQWPVTYESRRNHARLSSGVVSGYR